MSSARGYIGEADGSPASDNTVEVSGAGSKWDVTSGVLWVGLSGNNTGNRNSLKVKDGGMVSTSGRLIIGHERNYDNSVTITNGGALIARSGVTIAQSGGSLNTLNLDDGGRLTVGTNFNASMIGFNYNSGSTLAVEGQLSGLSSLEAGHRLETADVLGDMLVHGTFAPGNSPADSIVDGILTIAANGTLEMEVAGDLPGSEYDHLTVTDAAYLEGTLDIVLLDDFSVTYGDSFDLFNWDGGVSGEFASISSAALTGDLEWDTSELYTEGTLSVIPEPSSLLLMGVVAGLGLFIRRRFR